MKINYLVTGLCVGLLLVTCIAAVSAGSDIQIEGIYRELWNQSESEIQRVEVVDDLNGDANPDLLVFLEEENDHEIETVIAKAGKNGTILWEENVTGDDVDIDAFPVDDLNGDGVSDVIVVMVVKKSPENWWDPITETNVTIVAKVGKNGTHLWEEKENLTGDGEVWVMSVDDVDGDGKPDLIVSMTAHNSTSDLWNGSVIMKSGGKNGTHIWNESVNGTWDHFYLDAVPVDDVDGDGKPDIIVEIEALDEATSIVNTTVIMKSGINGTHLWEENITGESAYMGARSIDDVDGDGKPEIVVTTEIIDVNTSTRNLSIIVKGGKIGNHLWQENFTGYDPDPYEYLDWNLIPMADLNGDGLRDLIVGVGGEIALDWDDENGDDGPPPPIWNGTIIAKEGKTGNHLWQENHTYTSGEIDMEVITVGDLNGNGIPDVIVVIETDRYNATVIAKEGKNGTHLWQENITTDSELWGVRITPTDDLNCDGLPDVLVDTSVNTYPDPGTEFVIAKVGKNGTHLWEESISGVRVSIDRVYPVGDFSCDGKTDVVVYTRDWAGDIDENVMIVKEGKTGRHLVTLNSSSGLDIAAEYNPELYEDENEVEDYRYDLNCDGISDLLVYSESYMSVISKRCCDSSDADGRNKNIFFTDEDVYAIGSGFAPLDWINISVVPDRDWTDGDPIPADVSSDGVNTMQADANGSVFALLWPQPLTVGAYDIVFDADQNGVYNAGIDAVDSASPGFVVQERPTAVTKAVPVLTTLGLGLLMVFMVLVAVPGLKRRPEKK